MKKIAFGLLLILCSVFCLTGCYDAIFQGIRDEVELEEGTISGFVNYFSRFNCYDGEKYGDQYIFMSNGAIQCKNATIESHGAWFDCPGGKLFSDVSYSYYDNKFDGVYICSVVTDSTYVYALGYELKYNENKSRNEPGKFHLYYAKPVEANGILICNWQEYDALTKKLEEYKTVVDKYDEEAFGMSLSIHLFGTNTVNPNHRAAFIRIGGGNPYRYSYRNTICDVYKLDGSSPKTATPVATLNKITGSSEKDDAGVMKYSEITSIVMSCVYFDGEYHFSNYLNMVTDEGAASSSSTASGTTEPNYVYFGGYGDYVFSFRVKEEENADPEHVYNDYFHNKDLIKNILNGTLLPINHSQVAFVKFGGSVISLAVTNDSLLCGTGTNRFYESSSSAGKGIYKASLVNGKLAGIGTFVTNADSVMKSPYMVRALLCADPSRNEVETSLYSSVDFIYTPASAGTNIDNRGVWAYYPTRGNWNRE